MLIQKILKDSFNIAKATMDAFFEDRVFKLSAALAYYTVLAISPILMIIISVASMLYKKDAIEDKIYSELNGLIGHDLAHEVQQFVINSSLTGKSDIALITGLVVLFVASTAVFAEVQDSLNYIWQVKAKPKHGWLKIIRDRVLSFSVIVSLSFILLVSMLLNTLIKRFGHFFLELFMEYDVTFDVLFFYINKVVSILVTVAVFTLMFKVLPDVKLKWKHALAGGIFTAILFSIGQIGIGYYLQQFQPGLNFGSAGSIIALLVWVYYTSIIVYLGAEFTQIYAEKYGTGIQPSEHAVYLKIIEQEKNVDVLPKQHPNETNE